MDNKDKWMVVTDLSQIKKSSIYQEKTLVMVGRDIDINILKAEVEKRGGELASLPPSVEKLIGNNLHAFAYWANKHNPNTELEDIHEGNIRIKINDDEI